MLYCSFICLCFCSLFLDLKWWVFWLHEALTLPEAVLDIVMHSISIALKFSAKVTKEEDEKRRKGEQIPEGHSGVRNEISKLADILWPSIVLTKLHNVFIASTFSSSLSRIVCLFFLI